MNKRLIKYILISLTLLVAQIVVAKDYDTQLRSGIKFKADITKKFESSLEVQYRLNNNLSTFDKTLFEPEIAYEIHKQLKIGLNYRLINNQTKNYQIEYRHRGAVFLKFDKNLLKDFELKARTTLQYGFDNFSNSVFDIEQKLINRNRIIIQYDLFGSPLSPFAGYEFFYHINNPNGGIINQWRVSAGIDYKISNRSVLSGSYIFNNDRISPTFDDAHIIAIKLNYELR